MAFNFPMNDGVRLLDYLRVVYWRRWLAVTVLLTVVLAVAAYTFTVVPMYESRATILIESDDPNVINIKGVLDEGPSRGGYYETQTELLKSRALAQRTADALELTRRPEFGAATEAAAADLVSAGLQIVPVRGTKMVTVRFRSWNRALVVEVVNTHVRQYIQQSLENRFTASKDATDWLDAQLAKERKRVEQAESALQIYREQHDAVSLKSGQDIVVQKLADLNTAVTKAKTNRIDKEVQYRSLQAVRQDRSALDSLPVILANSFIQQLKGDLARLQREYAQLSESLGERHPTLIEKRTEVTTTESRLGAEIARVMESVEGAFHVAQAEEATLTKALEEQKREALTLNRRGIEYASLERDAESIRLVYQNLLQRAKETGVARELHTTNIRVIDSAQLPTRPISPRPRFNFLMSLLTGSLLAVGVVFFVEFIDDRIKTPDELRAQIGVPFLGLIPEVRSKRRSRLSLLQDDVPASFAEAVRAMRTGVVSSCGEKGLKSILVASAAEGEGKTLVAGNLAIALAQARQKVLLIDADMRRPGVHELFGHPLEPGLSNVLASTATLAEVLRSTTIPGLTVIPAGTPSVQTSELLGSAMFNELFEIMQEHFTWVIVDSPPVSTVTDASVVARPAGGVLFVVGSGMTRSHVARFSFEELQAAGGNVLGTILNRADLKRHPFYFSSYVRGEYRPASIKRTESGGRTSGTVLGRSA